MNAPLRTITIAAVGVAALAAAAIIALWHSGAESHDPIASASSQLPRSAEPQIGRSDAVKPQSGVDVSKIPPERGRGVEVKTELLANVASPAAPTDPVIAAKRRYEPGASKYRDAKRPEVRTILARVGADHEAEALWLQSINDASVPAKERKDLIEDLNEDGFSDPAKPSREDLALINNRIQLIDRLLPSAMDKVNEAAFLEARKDLVNMRNKLEE